VVVQSPGRRAFLGIGAAGQLLQIVERHASGHVVGRISRRGRGRQHHALPNHVLDVPHSLRRRAAYAHDARPRARHVLAPLADPYARPGHHLQFVQGTAAAAQNRSDHTVRNEDLGRVAAGSDQYGCLWDQSGGVVIIFML
jgi:hypothetical protein